MFRGRGGQNSAGGRCSAVMIQVSISCCCLIHTVLAQLQDIRVCVCCKQPRQVVGSRSFLPNGYWGLCPWDVELGVGMRGAIPLLLHMPS